MKHLIGKYIHTLTPEKKIFYQLKVYGATDSALLVQYFSYADGYPTHKAWLPLNEIHGIIAYDNENEWREAAERALSR